MANAVMPAEEAEKLAITYTPPKFPQFITPMARDFVAFQSSSEKTDFRIDHIVAEQTGISNLERLSVEKQVEQEALERLKEIQEKAYQEAYSIGMDEGRKQAFQEQAAVITERLERFGDLLKSIENLKVELVSFNETHMMKLIYSIASRMAMTEIKENKDTILHVLRTALDGAQSEENVNVRISQQDFDFIKQAQEKTGKDYDFLRRVKFEIGETVTPGGCIVETNYGVVDASVEQRVSKLWESISEKLPRVKDTVSVDKPKDESGDSGTDGT